MSKSFIFKIGVVPFVSLDISCKISLLVFGLVRLLERESVDPNISKVSLLFKLCKFGEKLSSYLFEFSLIGENFWELFIFFSFVSSFTF